MEFIAVLLCILLVVVVDVASGIASLATVYCWLCAIVLWGTVLIGLFCTIRAIFAGDRSEFSPLEYLAGMVGLLAVLGFAILCISILVDLAIFINNLIGHAAVQHISMRDLVLPWQR